MTTRVTALGPSDYRVVPWKNGAGSTTELWIEPKGATVQSGFDWRISLAQVPVSGPFSTFAGYQRTIILLQGNPMQLVHRDHGEHQLRLWEPYTFHGSWMTEALLSGGPAQDFNVMVRDGFGCADVHVQNARVKSAFSLQNEGLCFIYCQRDSFLVSLQNEQRRLTEQQSMLTEQAGNITLDAVSAESLAIVVQIKRHIT